MTYHVVGSQPDHKSVSEAAMTLHIPRGGEAQLSMLQPGEFIFRETQGPCSWPMLMRADCIAPSRAPRPDRFDQHPFLPGARLKDLPHVQEALDRLIAEHGLAKGRQARKKKLLSKKARDFLDLRSLRLYLPVARLWDELGKLAHSIQAAVRRELEAMGLALFGEIRVGRRNVLLMLITEKGWRFLGKAAPGRRGRGGIAHTHICEWLRMLGEKHGFEARTEWVIPGTTHPLDCVWLHDGLAEGFEVAIECIDNICSHARVCFIESNAIQTLTFIAPQKALLEKIKSRVQEDSTLVPFLDRIRYEPVETFLLKELWP